MKKWESAAIISLDVASTEHNWIGIYRDGGYIGDGEISGHLSWSKDSKPDTPTNTTPPSNDSVLS